MKTITWAEAEIGMKVEIGPAHRRIQVTILNLRPYGTYRRLITMRNEATDSEWTWRQNSGWTIELIEEEEEGS